MPLLGAGTFCFNCKPPAPLWSGQIPGNAQLKESFFVFCKKFVVDFTQLCLVGNPMANNGVSLVLGINFCVRCLFKDLLRLIQGGSQPDAET